MKRLIKWIVLASLVIVLLPASMVKATAPDGAKCVPLIAGQQYEVGQVCYWNNWDTLFIEYSTYGETDLSETHLQIVVVKADQTQEYAMTLFPTNKKQTLLPGKFDYQTEWTDTTITEYTYEIPLKSLICDTYWENPDSCDEWNWTDRVYVAAHAALDAELPVEVTNQSVEGSWVDVQSGTQQFEIASLQGYSSASLSVDCADANGNPLPYDAYINDVHVPMPEGQVALTDLKTSPESNTLRIVAHSDVSSCGFLLTLTGEGLSQEVPGVVGLDPAWDLRGSAEDSFNIGEVALSGSLDIQCTPDTPYEVFVNKDLVDPLDILGSLQVGSNSLRILATPMEGTPKYPACTYDLNYTFVSEGETAWAGETYWDDATTSTRWALFFEYQPQWESIVQWPVGGTMTVAMEDQPLDNLFTSDHDFNDWVVDIMVEAAFEGTSNLLRRMSFAIVPEARGAGYQHSFHLRIPEGPLVEIPTGGSAGYERTYYYYDEFGNPTGTDVSAGGFSLANNEFLVIPNTGDSLPGRLPNTMEPDGYGLVSNYHDWYPWPDGADYRPYVPPQVTTTLTIVYDPGIPFEFPADGTLFYEAWLEVKPYEPTLCNVAEPPDWCDGYEVPTSPADQRVLFVPVDWLWPEANQPICAVYPRSIVNGVEVGVDNCNWKNIDPPDAQAGRWPVFYGEWWTALPNSDQPCLIPLDHPVYQGKLYATSLCP